ncbi:ribonuclease H1-like isoform X2 [Apostichopus japonicus]|uniref:ribonuclease H1-like isoform X2 n=1 Tax=Stichopus japonicus TaxID=307972 RepID=UPI003AB1129B
MLFAVKAILPTQRTAPFFFTMGKYFYAVQKGWKTGIFETWSECQANVSKFPNAKFKKFSTHEEAKTFLHGSPDSDTGRSQFKAAKVLQPKHNVVEAPVDTTGAGVIHHCPCCSVGQAIKLAAAAKRAMDDAEEELLSKRPKFSDSTQKRNFSGTSASFNNSDNIDGQRVEVYTDGSCTHNGRRGARAGIGVHWIGQSDKDISERLKGKQTNQRAELTAAIRAIEVAKQQGIPKLKLYTDSKYTIKCATDWVKRWKRNGWKTANGTEVLNKEDVVRLDGLCGRVDVQWIHVPGHSNIPGNEAADKLAREGAACPPN